MRSYHIIRIGLWLSASLLAHLLAMGNANIQAQTNNSPASLQAQTADLAGYVVSKLKHFDLLMIGERHWTKEEPLFLQEVLRRCHEQCPIQYLFLEFGQFEDQAKVERFLRAPRFDPAPIIEILQNGDSLGWGYQEYFDIFKLVHDLNHSRPADRGIEIVLVNGAPDDVSLWPLLQKKYVGQSPRSREFTEPMVGELNDAMTDRDRFMADVIELHLLGAGTPSKGIYFAGSYHVQKCLTQKDYGHHRRYLATGGLLDRSYPGRVFGVALQLPGYFWQDRAPQKALEQLYADTGKPFAFDTANSSLGQLKLANRLVKDGVPLSQAFDGYIILNSETNYHRCTMMPEVYTDEFAKRAWPALQREIGPVDAEPSGKAMMRIVEEARSESHR